MAREIKNMGMAFSKNKKKTNELKEKFGASSEELKKELEILNTAITEKVIIEAKIDEEGNSESTKELKLKINENKVNFNKKGRYNLTLTDKTINKLDLLEKIIKKNTINQRIGGLRSKLIDHIVDSFFNELYEEMKEDK